jgi:hypothetical protein
MRATTGEQIIDDMVGVARISSPVRSRLQRIYAVYDFRRFVLDDSLLSGGAMLSDHSGVRPRPDWPQISYGQIHSSLVSADASASSTVSDASGALVEMSDRFILSKSLIDEEWHTLNYSAGVTTTGQDGVSVQYEGQVWGGFTWQPTEWPDVNVVASSRVIMDPPQLVSIVATGNGITNGDGTLKAGAVVTLTVTTTDAVIISGGTPSLVLNSGGSAPYTSGSGSTMLVFTYTVGATDSTSDLQTIGITKNGATIVSAFGTPFDAFTGNPTGILVIDTAAPVVSITSVGGADSTVTLQANDNLVVGTGEAGLLVTITSGGTTLGTTTANGSGAFSYALTPANITTIGQGAGKTVRASQTDAVGNVGTSAPFTFSLYTIGPVTITAVGGADSIVTNAAGDYAVTGTGDPNNTASIFYGATLLGTTAINGSGAFSYTFTAANVTTIGQGSNKQITATQSDSFGNSATSAPFTFTMDGSLFDPEFANVALLLKLDGSNNSSTFTDSSTNNVSVTTDYGGTYVKIKTDQFKFGGSSVYIPGFDCLFCADDRAKLGTGNHTVEFWIYNTVTPGTSTLQTLCAQWQSNNASGRCLLSLDSDRKVYLQIGGTAATSTITVPINTWVHVAYVRNAGVNKVYLNGTEALSFTASQSIDNAVITFGSRGRSTSYFWGYFDEVRITKNVARYTAPFTPPTQPFPVPLTA